MKPTEVESQRSQVRGIILAAGEGRRFGGNKQLAQIGESRLIECVLRATIKSRIQSTTVVLGARSQEIAPYVPTERCAAVVNVDWQLGIGSSIKCGFLTSHSFEDAQVTGVMIAVADQPHISSEHVNRMLAAHLESPEKIIATGYSGNFGTPVVFPRAFFLQLANLADGAGAKSLIYAHLDQVVVIGNELLALDIDTPKDLENWVETKDIQKPGLSRTDYAYHR